MGSEREAWEVAFREYWGPSSSSDRGTEHFAEAAFKVGYQAALASRPVEPVEGVPIQLDPRWRWVGVSAEPEYKLSDMRLEWWPEEKEWVSVVDASHFDVVSYEIFSGLLPGRLYEIVGDRLVERERHA